jgi:voltage-gated sodium channel
MKEGLGPKTNKSSFHARIIFMPLKSRKHRQIFFLFIKERTVVSVILLYALTLFFDGFPTIHAFSVANGHFLYWIEYACIIYFVVEAVLKISFYGFQRYWSSAWNKFDFIIVLFSLPSLLEPIDNLSGFQMVLALRMARLIRLFKLLRFIPHGPKIWAGVKRALQASIGVFLVLFFMNLLLAMGATILFGEHAPEYFGNPFLSIYSLFKVFTIEGWYEIPDTLAKRGGSDLWVLLVRGYFTISVLVGGILGLSLANAVFVDEMTADNTVKVEKMVLRLENDIKRLHEERQQDHAKLLDGIQAEISKLNQLIENQNRG